MYYVSVFAGLRGQTSIILLCINNIFYYINHWIQVCQARPTTAAPTFPPPGGRSIPPSCGYNERVCRRYGCCPRAPSKRPSRRPRRGKNKRSRQTKRRKMSRCGIGRNRCSNTGQILLYCTTTIMELESIHEISKAIYISETFHIDINNYITKVHCGTCIQNICIFVYSLYKCMYIY